VDQFFVSLYDFTLPAKQSHALSEANQAKLWEHYRQTHHAEPPEAVSDGGSSPAA